eukprot:COSAG03_NODE_18493_length_354_cov_0.607843_1_plen_29_part_10
MKRRSLLALLSLLRVDVRLWEKLALSVKR